MLKMRTNEGIPYHKWYFGLLEQATKKRSQKIPSDMRIISRMRYNKR